MRISDGAWCFLACLMVVILGIAGLCSKSEVSNELDNVGYSDYVIGDLGLEASQAGLPCEITGVLP